MSPLEKNENPGFVHFVDLGFNMNMCKARVLFILFISGGRFPLFKKR